jgi:tRNA pseudouridine38-40 synthase
MRTIKLTLEYDGSNFCGWQIQKNTNCRTIQGELEKALTKIFKQRTKIIGSGRTDAGVHAFGQVAHFKSITSMNVEEILRAINGNLPQDIAVINVEDGHAGFHSQFSAKRKIYRYVLNNRISHLTWQRKYMLHFPCHLNIRAMRRASKILIGKHDYRCFMAADAAKRNKAAGQNTVRTIYRLDIHKSLDIISLELEANGFLYKMVRNIVGTLLDIGTGKITQEDLANILKKKDRNLASETAPAHGLSLVKVDYK